MSFTVEEPMKVDKWTVSFYGRQRRAIGITYQITVLLECPFARILAEMYRDYEHISGVSVRHGHNEGNPEYLPSVTPKIDTDNQIFYRGE